ncbi:hypothetical protein [Cribrihabitans neustonicus]|uniref:hypothetical protein n=1 Tax=Cribrihabitans neustonicus TaxID=1429085 RepID=UPI003B5D0260
MGKMVSRLLKAAPFASMVLLVLLIAAAEAFPHTLIALTAEDGFVENLTALLFLFSGLVFFWCAYKAHTSPRRKGPLLVFCLAAWGVLLVVFAGEEISWGQRIFDFATPEAIDRANKQNEFNIHNLSFFDSFGGTGAYVSMLMLTVGLVLPILDRYLPIIGKIGIPVPSLACSILFVGAYMYGIYFKLIPAKFEAELQFVYFFRAIEIRELILSLATVCFAHEFLWRITSAPGQPGQPGHGAARTG